MPAKKLVTLVAFVAVLATACNDSASPAATTGPTTSTTTSSEQPPPTTTTTTTTTTPAGPTKEGAIARYEQYLHAVGAADVATICDIAGPAAKQAEDQGFGPCEQTIPITLGMISAAQKQALTAATVDPAQVTGDATTVAIPAAAIRATMQFTDSDIGDATMGFLDGQWFVTD